MKIKVHDKVVVYGSKDGRKAHSACYNAQGSLPPFEMLETLYLTYKRGKCVVCNRTTARPSKELS